MNGHEILSTIKDDERLRAIPTVILTTSVAEVDVRKSYQLQANCYLSKPVRLEAFEGLMKSVNDFWLSTAMLPQAGRSG
jgi:CheY-like chemotaxis protein